MVLRCAKLWCAASLTTCALAGRALEDYPDRPFQSQKIWWQRVPVIIQSYRVWSLHRRFQLLHPKSVCSTFSWASFAAEDRCQKSLAGFGKSQITINNLQQWDFSESFWIWFSRSLLLDSSRIWKIQARYIFKIGWQEWWGNKGWAVLAFSSICQSQLVLHKTSKHHKNSKTERKNQNNNNNNSNN